MTAANLRPDDTTATTAVLLEAKAAYDVATSNYWQHREAGGIVKADAYERDAGVKYKAATYDGGVALMAWQRARAELAAAMHNRQREVGRRP